MRLDIVVAPDCHGCEEARALAHALRGQFPALQINVIELDGRRPPPERVVATPTYLLDGSVVSLGNPRPAELVEVIRRRASTPPHDAAGPRRRRPTWRRPTA